MNNGKPSRSALRQFSKSKGFYIVLAVCAIAVGTAAITAVQTSQEQPKESEMIVSQNSPNQLEIQSETSQNEQENDSQLPSNTVDATPDVETPQPDNSAVLVDQPVSDDDSEAVEVTASAFVKPVSGEITKPFSVDTPLFSNTMNDWRVHTGVDIAATTGTQVRALTAGVVEDTFYDEAMGYTVVIRHADSLVSTYSNLQSAIPVEKGQNIDSGDVIGGVGESAAYECADKAHVHLEVTKDGTPIDPVTLFP